MKKYNKKKVVVLKFENILNLSKIFLNDFKTKDPIFYELAWEDCAEIDDNTGKLIKVTSYLKISKVNVDSKGNVYYLKKNGKTNQTHIPDKSGKLYEATKKAWEDEGAKEI